jgi:hypothetical protein
VNAAAAYKAIDDILFHLATAPQTKSVGYAPPERQSSGPMEDQFEAQLQSFKRAQFEPINSPAYVRNIHSALDVYDQLVLDIQDVVFTRLSPWERTLAGRWGSWQSLTPPIDLSVVIRFPRSEARAGRS